MNDDNNNDAVRDEAGRTSQTDSKLQAEAQWNEQAMMKLTDYQRKFLMIGWAAGFFDAEGHASERTDGSFNCSIDQATKDVCNLERFQNVVGTGRIVDLAPRSNAKHQLASRWYITNQAQLTQLIDAIGPYLTKSKRDQVTAAFCSPSKPSNDPNTLTLDVVPKKRSEDPNSGSEPKAA